MANLRTPDTNKPQFLVLAGGCFWGLEELIRRLPGVEDVVVGYTGGIIPNPNYEIVKTGRSGHAEAVKIEFDPMVTSREELLHFFFRAHDPTTKDRQGNDRGSQYRSAIFVTSPEERQQAEAVINRVNLSKAWSSPVVTTIEDLKVFYPAEEYHQDYLQKHPQGYSCHYVRDIKF